MQISEDGSYVYFVATGKLAAGAVQGQPNLYVTHNGEAPVFIATLTEKDHTDWLNGSANKAGPEINTAVVTPNGAQLAFISEQSLPTVNFPSAYDNQQAAAGECQGQLEDGEDESGMCREVYLYQHQNPEPRVRVVQPHRGTTSRTIKPHPTCVPGVCFLSSARSFVGRDALLRK